MCDGSNFSTSLPTLPPRFFFFSPWILSYYFTYSFSQHWHNVCHTPGAGGTARNKIDAARPQETCRGREPGQIVTDGMSAARRSSEVLYPKAFPALGSMNT